MDADDWLVRLAALVFARALSRRTVSVVTSAL